jgi:hypothetical protein
MTRKILYFFKKKRKRVGELASKREVRSPKNIARVRSEQLDILILLVRVRSEKFLKSKLDILKNQVRVRSERSSY